MSGKKRKEMLAKKAAAKKAAEEKAAAEKKAEEKAHHEKKNLDHENIKPSPVPDLNPKHVDPVRPTDKSHNIVKPAPKPASKPSPTPVTVDPLPSPSPPEPHHDPKPVPTVSPVTPPIVPPVVKPVIGKHIPGQNSHKHPVKPKKPQPKPEEVNPHKIKDIWVIMGQLLFLVFLMYVTFCIVDGYV